MATQDVEFAQVSFTVGNSTTSSGRRLLHDVSFRVAAGATTALLGRSGSGKTTLLRTVNRLVTPSSGRILMGGRDIAEQDVVALRRSTGYVIQETGLFPHMQVERNVGMALEVAGAESAAIHARAADMLELAGLPADVATRYPWQLSGGQRQRAGLARALASDPRVLLLDEPFGALDPLTRAEMQTMLKALLGRVGVTTLIVTHDLDEALFLADRIVLLEEGRVVADFASGDVRTSSNPALQAYVAATRRSGSIDPASGAGVA